MPPFSALTLDGSTVRLADVRGRMIVLHVWPTTCPSCSTHLPFLRDAYRLWAEEGLEIVSLSLDAAGEDSAVRAAVRRERIQHVVLRDPGRTIWGAIGMRGYPPILVIDGAGSIVHVQQAPVLESRKPAWLAVVERQFLQSR
jgi:peroxiredoxin